MNWLPQALHREDIAIVRERNRAVAAERDRDRYKAVIDRALGLIETASSRSRINQARDVLREALAPPEAEQAAEREDEPRIFKTGLTPHTLVTDLPASVRGEQAAAEAAGPEPGLAAPSVADYPGLLEDGPPNPENPELDGDE